MCINEMEEKLSFEEQMQYVDLKEVCGQDSAVEQKSQ